MRRIFFNVVLIAAISSIQYGCKSSLNVTDDLNYCADQTGKTLQEMHKYSDLPRNIENGTKEWNYVDIHDWTSGFWPGILWNIYEFTNNENIKAKADSFTMALAPIADQKATTHDLGFMMFCSFGNGYRLTENPEYKQIMLRAADTLATLFNPKVGTILSWPKMVNEMNWPHNTIIDNMMNLELLFWASKNGGNKSLYDIAVKHAETTMKNHFRPDYSSYHVVVYDTITGKKIKGVTHQGYADETMWARGQAWAIYGFTMTYRETKDKRFLDFAQKVADVYIQKLPEDQVPFWDFDAPGIPDAPKDASAAAITASALIELSSFIEDKTVSQKYMESAEKMLESLSSARYLSGDKNDAFLLHSTGHKPNNREVDASIIYADYYYLEALMRLKKVQEGKSIYVSLLPATQKALSQK